MHDALLARVAECLRPHVGRVAPMAEAGGALADHEERCSLGRTVVEIGA